jgi:hypothetical protein
LRVTHPRIGAPALTPPDQQRAAGRTPQGDAQPAHAIGSNGGKSRPWEDRRSGGTAKYFSIIFVLRNGIKLPIRCIAGIGRHDLHPDNDKR